MIMQWNHNCITVVDMPQQCNNARPQFTLQSNEIFITHLFLCCFHSISQLQIKSIFICFNKGIFLLYQPVTLPAVNPVATTTVLVISCLTNSIPSGAASSAFDLNIPPD